MIRLGRRASILLFVTASAVSALLLVIPIPDARHTRFLHALFNFGHVPMFLALTLLMAWLFGTRWWVFLLALVAPVLGEVIQAFAPSRNVDIVDLWHGVVGMLVAWIWCIGGRLTRPVIVGKSILSAVLLAFPLADVAPHLVDVPLGHLQFPVLADFSNWGQESRWRPHGAEVKRVRLPGTGPAGRLDFRADGDREYPGAEYIPVVVDWSNYDVLEIDFETAEPIELHLTLRDQRPRNNYQERFNMAADFAPGVHRLRLPFAKINEAVQNGPLDFTRIDALNFYLLAEDTPASITVHRIELMKAD